MTTTAQLSAGIGADSLWLRCPRCSRDLGPVRRVVQDGLETGVQCDACFLCISHRDGIWHALSPERERHFARFMTEYQIVRASEGRGSEKAEYYLALPFEDLSGANSAQWAIRAETFRALESAVLPAIETRLGHKLQILDIGAGNCWLSYRCALRGHSPVAVDLLTNDKDGLGAARHYGSKLPRLFPRFQAEADALPFANAQFDCVVFNASFHYSEDYVVTLAEAVRCTRRRGWVIIADTPWYSSEASGQQMIAERQQAFTAKFGFPSDGLRSMEYLTDERLSRLEQLYGLSWNVFTPDYGLRWSLRPWIARLKRRREPSQFRIYASEVRK